MIDAISLAQDLLRCPSVTPDDAGCLDLVESWLNPLGFMCHRLPFGKVDNLYARLGTASPNFCFAGHTDVVPPSDPSLWKHPPFNAVIEDGILYGRGVVDMKGAIAAFVAAVADFLKTPSFRGSISLLLTSDEEGPAIDGTCRVVEWLQSRKERIDACLVGEPTNPERVGQMIKIGRRGSLNACLTISGKAGHVAYPHLAKNPIPPLLAYLADLTAAPLDEGMEGFDPSNIEITTIDVNNPTSNVIPYQANAGFNIRFNPLHTDDSLTHFLRQRAQKITLPYDLAIRTSGEAFLCRDPDLQKCVSEAVQSVTKMTPIFSTSGGTSDARFLKDICPTLEFGLINATAHHVDECIAIDEITTLSHVYRKVLDEYFKDR